MFIIYVTDPNLLTIPDHIENYNYVGAAVSLSNEDPSPVSPGYAVKNVGSVDLESEIWDASTLDYVPRPVITTLPASKFFDLFTQAEKMAYWSADASADPVRRAMNDYAVLGKEIDRASAETSALLDVLIAIGVITAERKSEIIS